MKNFYERSFEKSKDIKPKYLSKNKTKDDNFIINKPDNQKIYYIKKPLRPRNRNNDSLGKRYFESNLTNSFADSKSNEKNLLRRKLRQKKGNYNNTKDIREEYSLYQKEMKQLLDKEQKLKLLKNQLKLKDNVYKSYINKSNEMSSINHSKPKKIRNDSKRINMTEINYNPIKERIKKYKKHTYYVSDLNKDVLGSTYIHKDYNFKPDLNKSLSKNKSRSKKRNQVLNQNLIKKLKMKNKLNKSHLNYDKDNKNYSIERNVDVLNNYHKYTLSLKKPKKNIINLNKVYKPTLGKTNRTKTKSLSKDRIKPKSKDKNSIKKDKLNKNNIIKSITNISSIKNNYKSKTQHVFPPKRKKEDKPSKKKIFINEYLKKTFEDKINQGRESSQNKNQIKMRSIDNIGKITKAGEDMAGIVKTNQDNYFVANINYDYKFIGVCDGHGKDGHHISEYLRYNLPEELEKEFTKIIETENPKSNRQSKTKNNIIETLELEKIKEFFKDAFVATNVKLIKENYMLNLENSGSTCITVFLPRDNINKIIVANVGDSRAIIVKDSIDNKYEQLSRDHKPSEKDEADRILEHGGEIEQIQNEKGEWEGPLRIFMKGEEGPGLAMSRSFGDVMGSLLGVIPDPEVTEYILKKEDKAIIIASDGLWEFVSNEEVADIVKSLLGKGDSNFIVNELCKISYERWKKKDCGIDDITIVCILLK